MKNRIIDTPEGMDIIFEKIYDDSGSLVGVLVKSPIERTEVWLSAGQVESLIESVTQFNDDDLR